MKSTSLLLSSMVLLAWLAVGCDGKELSTGFAEDEQFECNQCHGNDDNAAPPKVVSDGRTGEIDHELLAGVHQAHLNGRKVSNGVACEECHAVPEKTTDEGHLNGTVEVVFGVFAATGNLKPTWDAEAGTCSSVYCHGAKLAGGAVTEPEWIPGEDAPDATACGACHGSPPPAPHPQADNCNLCHASSVDENGAIIAGGTHLDGQKDFSGPHPDGYASPSQHGVEFNDYGVARCSECHGDNLKGGTSGTSCDQCHPQMFTSCTFCHGGEDNDTGAPPADLMGNIDTTFASVGAHTAHLMADSDWHMTVTCDQCHKVPAELLVAGHVDGSHDNLFWGALAKTGGLTPTYEEETCSTTYCHGGGIPGGSNTAPKWTVVDGSQAACGSCHALPPPSPHPESNNCKACHVGVVDENMNFIDPSLHIDGKLEVDPNGAHPDGYLQPSQHGADFISGGLAACSECHGEDLLGGNVGVSCEKCHADWKTNCIFCHGGVDNATGAPPIDMSGNVSTTFPGVGAHSAHVLAESDWHATFGCAECHKMPDDVFSEGHISGEAELVWGDIASKDDEPTYDGNSCSSSYCHDRGGSITAPVWTQVDGTQAVCGTCHGYPPSDDHPGNSNCSMCHGSVVNPDNTTFKDPSLHINGDVE